jgi:hypothetical protein
MTSQLPLTFRKRILAAAAESTLGTAVSLSNTNAGFRVDDRSLKLVRPTILRQAQGTFGSDQNVAGPAYTQLTFKNMISGSGTAATPAAWMSTFLPACGMVLTSSTYAASMTQSSWGSITAGHYVDGRLRTMVGGMGSWKLTGEVGKPGMMEWSFTGAWPGDPSGASLLSGMTYESVQPPPFATSAAFTFNGQTAFRISKFELDLGNDVKPREDANSPGGYLCGWIGNRQPKVSVDPEAMQFATENFYAAQSAGTEIGLTAVFGTVTNNIVTVNTTLQIESAPEDAERNGKLVDSLKLVTVRDLVSIAFS